MVRWRATLAHRAHPAVGAALGTPERGSGCDDYAYRGNGGFSLRLVLSAASVHQQCVSRVGKPALRKRRLSNRFRAGYALSRLPAIWVKSRQGEWIGGVPAA